MSVHRFPGLALFRHRSAVDEIQTKFLKSFAAAGEQIKTLTAGISQEERNSTG
jgi:hypothetical protein